MERFFSCEVLVSVERQRPQACWGLRVERDDFVGAGDDTHLGVPRVYAISLMRSAARVVMVRGGIWVRRSEMRVASDACARGVGRRVRRTMQMGRDCADRSDADLGCAGSCGCFAWIGMRSRARSSRQLSLELKREMQRDCIWIAHCLAIVVELFLIREPRQ